MVLTAWPFVPAICLQFIPPSLPVTLSQGLSPGMTRVWGSRLGCAPEPGQLLPFLHFCKANPYTRILTPGALYYWYRSSYLGLLFYINKEMSEN